MQAKVKRHDHYWVLLYEGDTSGLMPGPLPEVLEALRNGAHEIILDLSGVTYLGQVGLKALKETLFAARQHEANIGIAAPPPKIRRTLKLGGLTPDIPIYYNAREAITKLDMINFQESARSDLMDRLLIIQRSVFASPGGSIAGFRHCIQRQLFVTLPSFSIEDAAGSRNTSVFICTGLLPGRFQKEAVSVSHMSVTTSQSSFSRALRVASLPGPLTAGFMPHASSPLIFPSSMDLKSGIHE